MSHFRCRAVIKTNYVDIIFDSLLYRTSNSMGSRGVRKSVPTLRSSWCLVVTLWKSFNDVKKHETYEVDILPISTFLHSVTNV